MVIRFHYPKLFSPSFNNSERIMSRQVCKECGKLLSGRIDKKFCNDNCRSSYANRKYREQNKEINRINKILKRNHSILSSILSGGASECFTRDLFIKGFSFDYFTSINTTEQIEIYCYDISYRIEGEVVRIK